MTGIRVELQYSDGSFTSGMLRAGQSLEAFNKELMRLDPHFRKLNEEGREHLVSMKRVEQSHRGLLSTFRDLSVVAGGVALAFRALTGASSGLIGQIVKVNADIERMRFQMQAMSTASDPIKEAAENVSYLRNMIREVPFSLKELSNSFTKLKVAGIDPMGGSLQALADGIAAFGGTDEQLHRVTLGLSQMYGKSVIQMEEMRQQLSESMPSAMRIMARSMGVSMAELTNAIATGRVQAKPALDAFYAELERTYGGTAQQMMETFSGQVTKMHANLQLLATGTGLSDFVNVTLKNLLRAFNDFLDSGPARKMADDFGQTLTTIANVSATLVKTLYGVRDELVAFAKVGAAVLVIRGILSGFQSMGTAFTLLRGQMGTANAGMMAISASLNNMVIRARSGAGALLVLGAAARTAGIAASTLYSALSIALGPVAMIGTAIYAAGSYFGLFTNKVKEAYEEIEKFGAASRRAAQEAIDARIAQLQSKIDQYQKVMDGPLAFASPDAQAAQAEYQKELDELLAQKDELLRKSGENEEAATRRQLEREMSERRTAARKEYSRQVTALDEWLVAEQDAMETSGRTKLQINDEYQEKLAKARKDLLNAELSDVRKMLDAEQAARDALTTGTPEAIISDFRVNFLTEELARLTEQGIQLDQVIGGINFGAKIEDEASKIARGQQELERLTAQVTGLEAELGGASDEYAELMFRIKRGDFGNIEDGEAAVLDLAKALEEAGRQKVTLDKLLKGQSRAEADLERTRMDLIERRMEVEEKRLGRELTEGERIQLRLKNGFYEGLGPIDNIRQAIAGVVGAIDIQGDAAEQAGKVLRENTFGPRTVSQIDTVVDAIGRVTSAIAGLKTGMNTLEFGGFMGTGSILGLGGMPVSANLGAVPGSTQQQMSTITGMLKSEGLSDKVAAAIAGNFKVESSFNTSAVGDNGTSFGLAQWHNERWDNLKAFSGMAGMPAESPIAQIKFLMHELATDFPGLVAEMEAAASAADAASIFMRKFEIPDMSAKNKFGHEAARRQAAADAFELSRQGGTVAPAASNPTQPIPVYDAEANRLRLQQLEDAQVATTARYTAEAGDLAGQEREVQAAEFDLALEGFMDEMIAAANSAQVPTGELGPRHQKTLEGIENGVFGTDRNADSERYAALIAMAKELDAIEKEAAERKAALKASETDQKNLEQERLDIQRRLNEELARAENPDYVAQSSELRRLIQDYDEYIDKIRIAYGLDSAEYRKAQAEKAAALQQHKQLEEIARVADANAEARSVQEAGLTKFQQYKLDYERKKDILNASIQRMREANMTEVEIARLTAEQKAAIELEYAQKTNPLQGMMTEWGDLQGNLVASSTQWTDSMVSGISSALGSFRQLRREGESTGDALRQAFQETFSRIFDSLFQQVTDMGVKYLFSNMFGDKASAAGGKLAGAPSGNVFSKTAKAGSTKKLGAGVAHTGGIVGSSSLAGRIVSPSLFANAPRFHTGGIIDNKLLPSERPIIAQKGEGVFTPEQMKAMAPIDGLKGQQFQINAPVTVNGSAGTPDQNADLAKQVAREMEASMRGAVVAEIQKQFRPGNMLNQGRK